MAGWPRQRGWWKNPRRRLAPSTLAVVGRYILQPEVFEHLGRQKAGAGGEIQLTDSLNAMVADAPFHALRFEGERFDCGDKAGFIQATVAFALERDDVGGAVPGVP